MHASDIGWEVSKEMQRKMPNLVSHSWTVPSTEEKKNSTGTYVKVTYLQKVHNNGRVGCRKVHSTTLFFGGIVVGEGSRAGLPQYAHLKRFPSLALCLSCLVS